MLIDSIIMAKTPHGVEEFTGGSVQFSVSKYTRRMKVVLVLFFGFNFNRNPISHQIEIKEEQAEILTKELLIRTKHYEQSLIQEQILDLDTFVKDSYECGTKEIRSDNEFVRNSSSDSDIVIKDSDKVVRDSKKSKDSFVEYIKDNYDDDVASSYAYDFIDYRKSLGKPIKTTQALNMYMNELERLYNKGGANLIDKEIARMKGHEWQTIYAEDKQHKSKRG